MHYVLGFYVLAALVVVLTLVLVTAWREWGSALDLAGQALDLLDEELGPDDEQSPSPALT